MNQPNLPVTSERDQFVTNKGFSASSFETWINMFSRIILTITFWFFIKIFVGIDASSTPTLQKQHQLDLQSINYFNYNETKNILVGSVGGMLIIGWNHIRPLLEICKILIDRGHNVTFISPDPPSPSFNNIGSIIHHVSSGPSFNIEDMPGYQTIISEEYNIEMFGYLKNYFNSKYLNDFNLYKKVANEIKVDLFFCELFLNDACIDISWLMKKPLVTMSSKLSMSYAPYKSDPMIGCHVNMEQETFLKRFKCAIITPIQINYILSPYVKELDELKKSVGISSSNFFEKLQNSLFLANTFFGFEISHPTPPLYQEIGPIMSDDYLPLTSNLYNFIALHRKIIYISFGTQVYTTSKNNAILLQAFIEAINNRIIDGIIWSFVKSASKELFPSTITLSDNKTIDTLTILNNHHPSIHITEYTPQFSILNHANIKIHLTHGGIGSIYESLRTGTPMLLLPIAFDQFGNSEKLLKNNVGLLLSKSSLNVQDIINKIKILQTDKNILLNIERMKNLVIINSKRKFRAADLIDFVLYSNQLNSEQECQEGNKKNCDNEDLKVWITPETKMGFIRGKYLDVYVSLLVGCFIIILIIWKVYFNASKGENFVQ
ncbi:Glycosyltransferase Family 1 protein [Glomus cerebriforme]|uniref:Glycosyltransferase Family 1 protein n=1 Tax=Glomus cerebriforme TaxID=658196 RepID=A0A397S7K3_9GLOM|nr:Glycosyltransferase Family 1 protein [Glomus cerebriforme]